MLYVFEYFSDIQTEIFSVCLELFHRFKYLRHSPVVVSQNTFHWYSHPYRTTNAFREKRTVVIV